MTSEKEDGSANYPKDKLAEARNEAAGFQIVFAILLDLCNIAGLPGYPAPFK